ncbi:hypothetical protein Tco_0333016 [Tanacetum coccineum]
MLAPSGGGLIIYQAYGNLYTLIGRKAHLLEDKQISSVGVFDEVYSAFGWHLDKLHVTWAHLEKKRTRLQTYTKSMKKLLTERGDGVAGKRDCVERIPSVQNVENQVIQNAVQNLGAQNVGNQKGLIVVSGIANQNGNGNVVAARAEGNGNRNNENQVRCYNYKGMGRLARNCTVRPRIRDAAYLWAQLLIVQKAEAWI